VNGRHRLLQVSLPPAPLTGSPIVDVPRLTSRTTTTLRILTLTFIRIVRISTFYAQIFASEPVFDGVHTLIDISLQLQLLAPSAWGGFPELKTDCFALIASYPLTATIDVAWLLHFGTPILDSLLGA